MQFADAGVEPVDSRRMHRISAVDQLDDQTTALEDDDPAISLLGVPCIVRVSTTFSEYHFALASGSVKGSAKNVPVSPRRSIYILCGRCPTRHAHPVMRPPHDASMRDRQQGARRSVTSRIRITSLYTSNEKSLSRWRARSYRATVRLFAVTADRRQVADGRWIVWW